MKNLNKILPLLLLIFVGCTNQNDKILKIKIEYQPITTTIDAVSCDTYEKVFSETDKEIVITDTISMLHVDFSKSNEQKINVRGRLTIIYQNHQDSFCFDQFGLFYQNGKFYNNPQLWNDFVKPYTERIDKMVE